MLVEHDKINEILPPTLTLIPLKRIVCWRSFCFQAFWSICPLRFNWWQHSKQVLNSPPSKTWRSGKKIYLWQKHKIYATQVFFMTRKKHQCKSFKWLYVFMQLCNSRFNEIQRGFAFKSISAQKRGLIPICDVHCQQKEGEKGRKCDDQKFLENNSQIL